VGNEQTAEWYEQWIDEFATSFLEETLQKGQLKDPQAGPKDPPLFTPELLPRITVDLKLQLMRVVAHYKKECADRVLQVMELRRSKSPEQIPTLKESAMTDSKEPVHSLDFTSEEGRNSAVAAYAEYWKCSEAGLARTAKVDPADLSKWKKGLLPPASDKKARIENALRNNDAPTLIPKRPTDF
jgi:hypothetical protein